MEDVLTMELTEVKFLDPTKDEELVSKDKKLTEEIIEEYNKLNVPVNNESTRNIQ
jgi:hypothetical protein